MGQILIGTCSWTEPTLIESKRFYPDWARSAEDYLRYYSSQFPSVEVDSSYYALPSERNSRLWVERTPDDFTFNVKSFRLFTNHPAQASALPKDIRDQLTPDITQKNIYYNKLPSDILDELWTRFFNALLPLDSAGKLGVVHFQFPPWFHVGSKEMEYILSCKDRVKQYRMAVEFRNMSWLADDTRQQTLDFLRSNDIAFVAVDEPQGFKSSVPPVAEATSDIAIVRFHGRNQAAWEKSGNKASDRFNYYYNEDELEEWVPRIEKLTHDAAWVHILFNTNFQDQSVVNARKFADLLGIVVGMQGQLDL